MSFGPRLTRTCLLLLLFFSVSFAFATGIPPTTIFQLDGNAAQTSGYPLCTYDTGTATCDYWNLLNGTGLPPNTTGDTFTTTQVPPTSNGNWDVRTFIDGTLETEVFSQGSKDTQNTTAWNWAGHSSPNKDTFLAGYAAAYSRSGHLVLIFGANRLSANGDANVGVWFFQQPVVPLSNNTFGTGQHTNGDIFIISSFTGGGGTAAVTVYAWASAPGKTGGSAFACGGIKSPTGTTTPGQCADTNLEFIGGDSNTGTVCDGQIYCAVTNSATTTTTWNGAVATPLFFEGGVDITQAFVNAGLTAPSCISSFLIETRSSQSTSAELKDFLGGNFQLCGVSITKQCDTAAITAADGTTTYTFKGVVTNTGAGALYNVNVTDTYPTGAGSTTLTQDPLPGNCNGGTANCLGPNQTINYTGSFTLPATNSSAVNQASVSAAASDGGSTDCNNGGICAGPVNWTGNGTGNCAPAANVGLFMTKSCSTTVTTDTTGLLVRVDFAGTLKNEKCTDPTDETTCTASNVSVTGITLCDAHSGVTCPSTTGSGEIDSVTWPTAGVTTLGPGQSATYRGHYTTRKADSCTTITGTAPNLLQTSGRCTFTDTMNASGTGSNATGTQSASAAATCHLCPDGACSTGLP